MVEGNGSREVRKARLALARKLPRPDIALKLLETAYAKGNAEAAYALGTWYLHGTNVQRNLEKAIRLLRSAVDSKVANAMYDLAVCYERGVGVRNDPARAISLYTAAALHGEKQSVYEVGRCYYHGIGVQKNRSLAKVWLDRARELGLR